MKLLPLALVALLAIPLASAQTPSPVYPPDITALLPAFIADSEALATDADRAQPWWAEASGYLERAKTSQAEGRFRVTLFHLETYRELVIGNRLLDAARAEGGGKAIVLQRTSGVHDDAQAAWLAYRARVHAVEREVRSLHTVEKAIYATDMAMTGALTASEYDLLAEEFPKQEGVPEGFVFGLVRASSTALVNIQWADAVLSAALAQEGLPPQVEAANWTTLMDTSIAYGLNGTSPAHLEALDSVARPARANGEGIVAVTALLAEQRLARANSMQTIFGDARTRGLDVVNDAASSMRKQLNNTTMASPQAFGLTGVLTADAIDRSLLTIEYLERGAGDLGSVIGAWSALEHQAYASNAFSTLSPIRPPPTPVEEKGAPGAGFAAMAVLVAMVALATRRRSG